MAENLKEQIENKVIDCINAGLDGRLIIFKPQEKGLEDYLAVERRGNYKAKELYFQINSIIGPTEKENLIKDFTEGSLKTGENFYLLFLYFDELKQEIGNYVWLIPSLYFIDTAQATKSLLGEKILRFEASLNIKKKNKYSKFIINTGELGKIILDAFEGHPGKINFTESISEQKESVNIESLKAFLCEARKNTYASSAATIDNPRLLASTQLEFQKANYFYRDVFFNGNKKFIGQEIVYLDSKPIWGMNYIGDQIGKLETDFLKESLVKLVNECRMGVGPSGSCENKKRDFKYKDSGQGDLGEFFGTEEIFQNSKSIYKLTYRGGLI